MLSGHFVDSAQGKVFVSQHGNTESSTAILCLPPLFEELNLSRAIMAKQAQYFAEHNYPCYIMDYAGTGDSEGEIDQMETADWVQNVLDVGSWLQERGVTEIILWGVRFGALLAMANQTRFHQALPVSKQLFWKPVLKGKMMMSQFIRLKQANSMMQKDEEKVNWRQHILDGNTTEIAGYPITNALLTSLEGLLPEELHAPGSSVAWVELGATKVTPAITKVIGEWPEQSIDIVCLESSAFWQIPEIFELSQYHKTNLSLLEGK